MASTIMTAMLPNSSSKTRMTAAAKSKIYGAFNESGAEIVKE